MREAFAEYAGKLPQESGALRETLEDVRSAMAGGGAALAFMQQTAVASARFLEEERALYVGRVAVLPAWRRRGVASAMMRFLEDVARQRTKAAIHIGVRESLPSNVALYMKLGYRELIREPHGADRSITMLKQL